MYSSLINCKTSPYLFVLTIILIHFHLLSQPPRLYESATVPQNKEDSGDYDEVISPLLSDKIEYVQIKPSPPGPITPTKSDHDAADVESSCEVW